MRRIYSMLLYLLLPWLLLRLALRGMRNPDYWRRWDERFGLRLPDFSGGYWIHAVSVGEVRAAVPLIEALRDRDPEVPVLVTTMTPTGSDQVLQLLGDSVTHCYAPYDFPGPVRRFLDRVQPRLAVIMETELWPNLFHGCRARGVPLLVANVRLSEKSARGYLRYRRLARETVAMVDRFGVQSEADAERLRRIGAPPQRLQITGNIKFELSMAASLFEIAEALRRDWGTDRPVLLAASTHDGEEVQLLELLPRLREQFDGLLLVIVPRHPERFNTVAQLCRREDYEVALRSEARGQQLAREVDIVVGDTMGELLLFYAACDVAFVGGSLVNTGGHNMLEACAVGKPVVFGPHTFNFAEVSRLVVERSAGLQVRNEEELATALIHYIGNASLRYEAGEAGRRLVEENKGALDNTMVLIEELLRDKRGRA